MTPPTQRTAKFPPHIDPVKLPNGIVFDPRGRGAWRYRKGQGRKNRGRSIRLGDATLTLAEIWSAVERLSIATIGSIKELSLAFHDSSDWLELKPTTQKDYLNSHKAICATITKSGVLLGDMPLNAWTPGAVRRYRDTRRKSSVSRAASEVRYLKRVFVWGIEYEYVVSNPAKDVKPKAVEARHHYVSDGEYRFVLDLARQSGSPYLANIMELAYMCRLRLSEVLDLDRSCLLKEGLLAIRRKGSKDALVTWTDRLKTAVCPPGQTSTKWLFVSKSGGRMAETTVQTAWQRLIKIAVERGLKERFTLHDLKRKGVSDFQGDKLAASGHRSPQMLQVYDVLPATVAPTEKADVDNNVDNILRNEVTKN